MHLELKWVPLQEQKRDPLAVPQTLDSGEYGKHTSLLHLGIHYHNESFVM